MAMTCVKCGKCSKLCHCLNDWKQPTSDPLSVSAPAQLSPEMLGELAEEIRAINEANGWNVFQEELWGDPYRLPAILGLVHSEVSEALEAFRKDDRDNFLEEMADVLIRVLDCVGGFDADFDAVVAAKLAKNRSRGYRHGGKKV